MEYRHIQVKVRQNMSFYSFPMTLLLKRDLDMVKIYLYIGNEIPSYNGSNYIYQEPDETDRNTGSTEINTYPK